MAWIIRHLLTSTDTSRMGVPVSLSINVSQDLGRETAFEVPTWITFLMMGVSLHLLTIYEKYNNECVVI
jgi:hypothetical protein